MRHVPLRTKHRRDRGRDAAPSQGLGIHRERASATGTRCREPVCESCIPRYSRRVGSWRLLNDRLVGATEHRVESRAVLHVLEVDLVMDVVRLLKADRANARRFGRTLPTPIVLVFFWAWG